MYNRCKYVGNKFTVKEKINWRSLPLLLLALKIERVNLTRKEHSKNKVKGSPGSCGGEDWEEVECPGCSARHRILVAPQRFCASVGLGLLSTR